jgi:hypothetical protein
LNGTKETETTTHPFFQVGWPGAMLIAVKDAFPVMVMSHSIPPQFHLFWGGNSEGSRHKIVDPPPPSPTAAATHTHTHAHLIIIDIIIMNTGDASVCSEL